MLRERKLQLLLAVTPDTIADLSRVSATYQDAGVELGLWPMLDDAQGRWGSTFNAGAYSDFVQRAVEIIDRGTTLALDLEPPIYLMRRLLRGDTRALRELVRSGGRAQGLLILQSMMHELRSCGNTLLAAAPSLVLADRHDQPSWQWLMGTPFSLLPFDVLSCMSYTSLLEGYSAGFLPREAAMALHAQTCVRAAALWQERASVSLGVVDGGALGDERPYRSVIELVEDVAVARACGIEDMALFDLSGVLRQKYPEAWLDAFVFADAADALPRSRRRVRALERSVGGVSTSIHLVRRVRVHWRRIRRI